METIVRPRSAFRHTMENSVPAPKNVHFKFHILIAYHSFAAHWQKYFLSNFLVLFFFHGTVIYNVMEKMETETWCSYIGPPNIERGFFFLNDTSIIKPSTHLREIKLSLLISFLNRNKCFIILNHIKLRTLLKSEGIMSNMTGNTLEHMQEYICLLSDLHKYAYHCYLGRQKYQRKE